MEGTAQADVVTFKRCSLCNTEWKTKDDFLNDPDLRLNGYQFGGREHRTMTGGGLLLFTHLRSMCGTTLAVYVRQFKEHLQEGR